MNIIETSQALALAQAFDRRTVGEMDVRAWHAVIGNLDAADVMAAIQDYYSAETDWIMPAHIRRAVGAMVKARSVSPWAPGQYGVPVADAMPEVSGPIDESAISPSVRALLEATRAMLPEGSRDKLMPRRVAWEKEYAAHERFAAAEPNPHYRPKSADADTGILPNAHRCADCPFVTSDAVLMDAHLSQTGHVHE